MLSERMQRQVDRLLDAADTAMLRSDWETVRERAQDVLALDPQNEDALTLLAATERRLLASSTPVPSVARTEPPGEPSTTSVPPGAPTSIANGRYLVRRLLGEGATKRVYLAHDTRLDRDVAFALIRTEGLDEDGLARIRREAQAMGRLGDHPNIVTVYDIGEENGQPFIVSQLMAGGSLESLLDQAEDHRLPFEDILRFGHQITQALEHAHQHGIVHRDLKPGNVWLTTPAHPELVEGRAGAGAVAKLGDFGLALALDRSRLTQSGMMVGTVSYMPPEQALAGEVTPRSDLYSLGCVLYEMVTGRPPFVAEESIAIITQALNVPPIMPAWYRPDCPPALEALILRLLEKDPARRPGSAADVRQALAAITQALATPGVGALLAAPWGGGVAGPGAPGAASGAPTGFGTPGYDNPLYRRTFVGREPELRQRQSLFDQALSGQGSLVMVIGEPGIGKTALCEQLATYAAVRGGRTLVGHCYEEGSFSLPYQAFVEALRTYILARPPEALRDELGTGAADVARIVSEVRERLDVELRQAGDPEEDRWRLLQAVTSFLQHAASSQPLVLVLEDLHWADRGTLDLLTHLVRNLSSARILVVGTYRDVEVDRAHPLAATLAELRRGTPVARVLLRGLTADEVSRMMSSLADQEVPWGLAEAVHRQTEGNPLFIQEVLRYLVEEGLITRETGTHGRAPLRETSLQIAIPEGLRDVIGRRLSKLSPECNRLLSIAAVVGRDFMLETLQAVANQSEEQVLAGIEEATRVGVLEDRSRGGTLQYRFAHAFFRQTLYEEMFTPRRLRMHQQVARVLEQQYVSRLEEHAAELVEHFAQSSDPIDIRKAVHYGELAARRAMGVYAYGEAVRLLEEALEAQAEADPGDKAGRCDLLLALGEALMPGGDPQQVYEEVAEEALGLAEALGDQERASRACEVANRALMRYGSTAISGTPVYQRWAERADRSAAPGTLNRVLADMALANVHFTMGRYRQSRALVVRAMELAQHVGQPEALFRAFLALVALGAGPQHQEDLHQLATEVTAWPREGTNVRTLAQALAVSGTTLMAWGERELAEKVWDEVRELGNRTRDPGPELNSLGNEVRRLMLAGDLEGAVAAGARRVARGDEVGAPLSGRMGTANETLWPLVWLGRGEEFLDLLDALVALAGGREPSRQAAQRATCLAHLGRHEEAMEALRGLIVDVVHSPEGDETQAGLQTLLLEAAVVIREREVVRELLPRLREMAGMASSLGPGGFSCVGRNLGAAAAFLGDLESSRQYYKKALEVATKIRFRPEIALTRLQMAELCLEEANDVGAGSPRPPAPHGRGDLAPTGDIHDGDAGAVGAHGVRPDPAALLDEAQDHLDFCIPEFGEMKMAPALARALRLQAVLEHL